MGHTKHCPNEQNPQKKYGKRISIHLHRESIIIRWGVHAVDVVAHLWVKLYVLVLFPVTSDTDDDTARIHLRTTTFGIIYQLCGGKLRI